METIEVDGLRIAFERAGTGPALVLLHGFVGDGSSTWRNQVESLCDRFTVVAWDAPGAGGSSDPPETLGMAGYADVLARFVTSLDLEHPHVCGLSFGGALALELARRHPKSLGRSCWHPPTPGGPGRFPPMRSSRACAARSP
jgi:pimeloyl-ACP methyl ester carboxylesterase